MYEPPKDPSKFNSQKGAREKKEKKRKPEQVALQVGGLEMVGGKRKEKCPEV